MLRKYPVQRRVIPLWGGLEATVNRVGDHFQDQFDWSGHADRLDDLDLVAQLGVSALRTPILWERVESDGLHCPNWDYADRALGRLREVGVRPIAGLIHHGSGPTGTDLLDPCFPEKFAAYARRVAERYPWLTDFTPVNEPLTTARFSALYGHWYPHARDDQSFVRALLNQVRAVVLAMRQIEEVNPGACLIQTDDLGKTHATPRLAYQAEFENERRWITWDLLAGRVTSDHPVWPFLISRGAMIGELEWFVENPRQPDVIGVNHYITSERFLDDRLEHHSLDEIGGNGRDRYADVAAVRVRTEGCDGFEGVLTEAWERYRLPVAVTECHIGCTREEQLRWLVDAWEAANRVQDAGAEIAGFTAWSLFGAFDWNSLLTEWRGSYEPGVFDLQAPTPRATALASALRRLAAGFTPDHPTLTSPGWWERPERLHHPPLSSGPRVGGPVPRNTLERPILIAGANSPLGQAFAELCELRGLSFLPLLQFADAAAVDHAIAESRAWAIVHASLTPNLHPTAPVVLAEACEWSGIPFVTFTSDQVFDGHKGEPYHEGDEPNASTSEGLREREIEQRVQTAWAEALIVRTSTVFGTCDLANTVHRAVCAMAAGRSLDASANRVVSPTFAPDLVHATLDLLIDGEKGIWHLTNRGTVQFWDFIREIAKAAGLPTSDRIVGSDSFGTPLVSRRGWPMPPWEDAVARSVAERFVESVRCA